MKPTTEPVILVPRNAEEEQESVRLLKEAGFEVIVIADPRRAISIGDGKNAFWKPKAFIVDIIIPNISSFDLVRQLTERYASAKIPVLMASPYQTAEDAMEAVNSGALAVITKPIQVSEFKEVLEKEAIKKLKKEVFAETFNINYDG